MLKIISIFLLIFNYTFSQHLSGLNSVTISMNSVYEKKSENFGGSINFGASFLLFNGSFSIRKTSKKAKQDFLIGIGLGYIAKIQWGPYSVFRLSSDLPLYYKNFTLSLYWQNNKNENTKHVGLGIGLLIN